MDEDGVSGACHLPSLNDLSKILKVSVSQLREQMEVARSLGFVEVKPRTGIRRLPYNFYPAVKQSLSYAISLDRNYFDAFADLRHQIESTYWYKAVSQLTPIDLDNLDVLIENAWCKLNGSPVQIPHDEHRQIHLLIYSRLENPFVNGLLKAYWDAYEAVGLDLYADYQYLVEVWNHHQNMVRTIRLGDFEAGYQALIEHNDLIHHRLPHSRAGVASATD